MSNIDIINELKGLAEVKDRMLDNKAERDAIQRENDSMLNSVIDECTEELENFMLEKNKELSNALPQKNYAATTKIAIYDGGKVTSLGAIAGLVFYASLILFVLSIFGLSFGAGMATIIVGAMLVSGILWLTKGSAIGKYFDWKQKREKWRSEALAKTVSKEEMIEKCEAFENEFRKAAAEYTNKKNIIDSKIALKREEIEAPDRERLAEINAKLESDYNTILENTVLHPDHMKHIESIISFLETGRADDLKEAINMAIEEQERIENENQRRAEAYRQQKILEEQARQTQLHNMEMERLEKQRAEDARVHAAQMEAQARKQAEETKKLREEIERQNRKY